MFVMSSLKDARSASVQLLVMLRSRSDSTSIFCLASEASAGSSGSWPKLRVAKDQDMFARLRGYKAPSVGRAAAERALSRGVWSNALLETAHNMAARSRSCKDVRLCIDYEAIASHSGWSSTVSAANAHDVFDRFCGMNSDIRGIAADEIAAMRVSTRYSILEKAQAVLASP